MQQGEPNQLYLKLHLGEWGEHIIHVKFITLAGGLSIDKLVKNVTRFVLSSLECIYSNTLGAGRRMLLHASSMFGS